MYILADQTVTIAVRGIVLERVDFHVTPFPIIHGFLMKAPIPPPELTSRRVPKGTLNSTDAEKP